MRSGWSEGWGTEGNAGQQSTCRAQDRESVSQALDQHCEEPRVNTRFLANDFGKSRMREFRSYGSVRGARGNSRPYREMMVEVTKVSSQMGRRKYVAVLALISGYRLSKSC